MTNYYKIKGHNKKAENKDTAWRSAGFGIIYYANWYISKYHKPPQRKPTYKEWYRYMTDCYRRLMEVPAYEYIIKGDNWRLFQLIDESDKPFIGYSYDEEYGNLIPYEVVFINEIDYHRYNLANF